MDETRKTAAQNPAPGRVTRSRMAEALRELRDKAGSALAGEAPPRRIRPKTPALPRLPSLADGLSPAEISLLAEGLDAEGRVLICAPPERIARMGLSLRLVITLLRFGGKILLHRRAQGPPDRLGLWDFSVGYVPPGMAAEDRALALLTEETGMAALPVRLLAEGRSELDFLSLFEARLPSGLRPTRPELDLLECDEDEFSALIARDPELFSPEVLWAAGTGALFPRRAAAISV